MIPRLVEDLVFSKITTSKKIVLLFGARQVGKTTLVRRMEERLKAKGKRVQYFNCDFQEEKDAINTTSKAVLGQLVSEVDALLIDEAQRLDNPGLTLKNIHTLSPDLYLLATGSSSFELKNTLSDSLTGRYVDFTLYPFSFTEVIPNEKPDALLPSAFVYGLYPEVYLEKNPSEKQALLNRLVDSYLFRDVLTFQRVQNSQAIKDLTRALAYQIGSEVNPNELANRLKIDRKTVINYLEVLEKSFVIVTLTPFSKNPRREIGKNSKVYFVDLGVRNALIGDFNPMHLRADAGAVWENFLVLERLKSFANRNEQVSHYFWRHYSGAEVDYLEKRSSRELQAFELKVGSGSLRKGARSFTDDYGVKVQLINGENYLDFIR
ncbi:MAG: ATP-binding protein [bacterium]|nr:ATP-binding protein [bacterium]